jgi:hypothetical protein
VLGVAHISLPWSDLHPSWSPTPRIAQMTDNGECLKMAVRQQILLTSFAHAINHAAEDEPKEDVLQQVVATTI